MFVNNPAFGTAGIDLAAVDEVKTVDHTPTKDDFTEGIIFVKNTQDGKLYKKVGDEVREVIDSTEFQNALDTKIDKVSNAVEGNIPKLNAEGGIIPSSVYESSDKLGIHNTNPDGLLEIGNLDDYKASFKFKINSTSGYSGTFTLDDSGLWIGHNADGARAINFYQGNKTPLKITKDNDVIFTEGNVGIGTDSPNYLLDIDGGNVTNKPIAHFKNNAGNGGFYFTSYELSAGTFDFLKTTGGRWNMISTNGGGLKMSVAGGIGGDSNNSAFDFVADANATKAYRSIIGIQAFDNGSLLKGFDKDNNELFTFNTDGNVGIGTDNPEQKLHVVGNVAVYKDGIQRGILSQEGTFVLRDSNGNDKFYFTNSGNSFLLGGNVGIGTASPGDKLEVNGGTLTKELRVQNSSNQNPAYIAGKPIPKGNDKGGAVVHIRDTEATADNNSFGGIVFSSSPGRDFAIGKENDGSDTRLAIRDGNDGSTIAVFTDTKKVGIGTENPYYKFETSGDIATSKGSGGRIIAHDNNSDRDNNLTIGADSNGSYIRSDFHAGGKLDIRFIHYNAEVMRIKQGGNVGIGVDNPDGQLTVKVAGNSRYGIKMLDADGGNKGGFYIDANKNAELYLKNSNNVEQVGLRADAHNYIKQNLTVGGGDASKDTLYVMGGITNVTTGTQPAWASGYANFDNKFFLFNGGDYSKGVFSFDNDDTQTMMAHNAYYDGSDSKWKYKKANLTPLRLDMQSDNGYVFYKGTTGDNDDQPTSWSKLAVIKPDGKVGIGTATPEAYKFHVASGDSSMPNKTKATAVIENSGSSNGWYVLRVGSNGDKNAFAITNAGNIGIGTENPERKFHLHNSSRVDIVFDVDNFEKHYIRKDGHYLRFRGNDDDTILFELRNNSSGNVATFPSGNVMIGAGNPSSKLEIKHNGSGFHLALTRDSNPTAGFVNNGGLQTYIGSVKVSQTTKDITSLYNELQVNGDAKAADTDGNLYMLSKHVEQDAQPDVTKFNPGDTWWDTNDNKLYKLVTQSGNKTWLQIA